MLNGTYQRNFSVLPTTLTGIIELSSRNIAYPYCQWIVRIVYRLTFQTVRGLNGSH